MIDEQHKTVNQMYASKAVKKLSRGREKGQSKYTSQTTWGPSRHKKKSPRKEQV